MTRPSRRSKRRYSSRRLSSNGKSLACVAVANSQSGGEAFTDDYAIESQFAQRAAHVR
jgi:hypothetical protein